MVTIARATPDMFDAVHEVLREFGGALTKKDWRRLFDYRFSSVGYRGWVAIDGGEITGYLGAIFSERLGARFCSLTSWIVKKARRTGDLSLLAPVFDLVDHTLLNFSPSKFTLALFKRFGFSVLDDELVLLPPVLPQWAPYGSHVVSDPRTIQLLLDPQDMRIFRDHAPYPLTHLVLTIGSDYCYIVASRTKFRRYPSSFIHYVSNPALFCRATNPVLRTLARQHGTLLTTIDGRLLEGNRLRGAHRYVLDQPRLYRPALGAPVRREAIDSLYSEFVVLNPNRWTFNF